MIIRSSAAARQARQKYFAMLCAKLEPEALEPWQKGTFTYVVPAGVHKMAYWAYRCSIDGSLLEIRESRTGWLNLSGVTVTGMMSTSYIAIIDPTLGRYDDAEDIYYSRMSQLLTMPVYATGNNGTSINDNDKPLLVGPYGALMTNVTFLDYAWCGTHNVGTNEINDADPIRQAHQLDFAPIRRGNGNDKVTMLPVTGNGYGWHYHILPANWSRVPDIFVGVGGFYVFRDDFLGASLDTTTKWTRSQSTAGNVEIVTKWAWCKATGNNTWTGNGAYAQTGVARSSGASFVCDVYFPIGTAGSDHNLAVGWLDGTGISNTKVMNGISFSYSGAALILNAFEAGTSTLVGSGFTDGHVYRVRIRLLATGAVYEIQGGTQYPAVGSATWTDISVVPTTGTTATVYPGFVRYSTGDAYVGDVRVY